MFTDRGGNDLPRLTLPRHLCLVAETHFLAIGQERNDEKQRDYRRPVMHCYLIKASIHWSTT